MTQEKDLCTDFFRYELYFIAELRSNLQQGMNLVEVVSQQGNKSVVAKGRRIDSRRS